MSQFVEPDPVRTRHLLERALAGDRACESRLFGELSIVLRHEARAHRLMPLLRRSASEEDVVNEAWVRFYSARAYERFEDRGPGSLRRFLVVIVDRVLHDWLRRASAGKRIAGGEALSLESLADGGDSREIGVAQSREPTPTKSVRDGELLALVREALDERERLVWERIEVEQRSSIEVAHELGISDSAVRGVIHRARAKLIGSKAARALEP